MAWETDGPVTLRRTGGTAIVCLNRPQQRNALDPALRSALSQAIGEVRGDAGVRALVLTGAGGHFCAGGDIRSGVQTRGDVFEGRERMQRSHRWLEDLADLEKPVIAAVDGSAFGAGLSLALAADFILASRRARFCSAFVRLGYVPDLGAMYLLPRAVGLARAKDLVFTGRVVEAAEAQAIGLVQQVVEGDVLEHAMAFARRFEAAPRASLGMAKSVLNQALESDRRTVLGLEAMAQAICRESAFHQEAVRRFLAREPAVYP
ncbi:MAG TPA: enoyl-CoA hydratase/isomerase family protein [Aquabacterium sp.]|nr:enoyl-CoA hydratase/isomerase family protein [Aquabacterium sp.]